MGFGARQNVNPTLRSPHSDPELLSDASGAIQAGPSRCVLSCSRLWRSWWSASGL